MTPETPYKVITAVYCNTRPGFADHTCSAPNDCVCACHLKESKVPDNVETYRTVHVGITFTTYGTAAQAHRAGTKAAYDVELALHRSIESKVWIEEAIL